MESLCYSGTKKVNCGLITLSQSRPALLVMWRAHPQGGVYGQPLSRAQRGGRDPRAWDETSIPLFHRTAPPGINTNLHQNIPQPRHPPHFAITKYPLPAGRNPLHRAKITNGANFLIDSPEEKFIFLCSTLTIQQNTVCINSIYSFRLSMHMKYMPAQDHSSHWFK